MALRILRGGRLWRRRIVSGIPPPATRIAIPLSTSASTSSSFDADDDDEHKEGEHHSGVPRKKSALRSLGKHSSALPHFQHDADLLRRMFEERRWGSRLEQALQRSSPSMPPLSDGLIVEVLKTLSEARLSLRFFLWTVENRGISPSPNAVGVLSRRWGHERRFDAFLKALEKACLHGYGAMDSCDFSKLLMGYGWAGMAEKAIQTLEAMRSLTARNANSVAIAERTIGFAQSSAEMSDHNTEMVQGSVAGRANQNQEIMHVDEAGKASESLETLETMQPSLCSAENASRTLEMETVGPNRIVVPEASHFLIVLDILEREKLFESVPDVYSKMLDAGFFPDQETYKKLIAGLCIAGHKEKARKLLDDMKAAGLRPEPETYRIVLSMFSKANKVVEVLTLFNEILDDGIEPDAKACNALVKAFCSDGKVQEGLEVVEMMLARRLNPNLVSLNMVVEGLFDLSRLDDVFALWEKLTENSVPTLTFHHRLVIELSKAGKLSMAELVVQDIKKKSMTLPDDVCAAFANGLSKEGGSAKAEGDKLAIFVRAQNDGVKMDDGLPTAGEIDKEQEYRVRMDGGLVSSKLKEFDKALADVIEVDEEIVSTVGGSEKPEINVINVDGQLAGASSSEKDVMKMDNRSSEVIGFEAAQKGVVGMNGELLEASSIVKPRNDGVEIGRKESCVDSEHAPSSQRFVLEA